MGATEIARLGVVLAMIDQFSPQMDSMIQNAEKTGARMKTVGANMTAAFTAPLVGIGAAAAEAFGAFEQKMNIVQAVVNPTADDLERLKQAAMDMGAATQFSATEAAEALGELGKAGFDANASIVALPATLDLAASAQMSMKDAAELGAQVLKQFGLEASDLSMVTDVLSEAANKSAVDVTQLRESLKFVGPVAASLGVSFNDTAAALAVLGDAGFKADIAGTALRNMFTRLVAPPKAMSDALEQLSISVKDSTGNFKPMADIVDEFKTKLGSIQEPAERTALVMKAFGARAGPSFLALLEQGGDKLREMEDALEKSGGAAQRTRDIMMQGLGGALEKMRGSVETAGIALGEALAPAIITVAGWLEKAANFLTGTLIPAFGALPEPVQLVVLGLLAIVAAVGPVLVIVGTLMTAIGPIVVALGGWTVIMGAVGTALGALLSPIALVVAAVVGLGLIWMKWGDDIKKYVSEAYTAVKEWLWDKFGAIVNAVSGFLSTMAGYWDSFKEGVSGVVKETAATTKSFLVDKFDTVKDGVKSGLSTMKGYWDAHNEAVGKVLGLVIKQVSEWIKDISDWLGPKLKAIFDGTKAIIDLLLTFYIATFTAVITKVTEFFTAIGNWFGPKLKAIVDAVKTILAPIVTFFTTVKDQAIALAQALFTGVYNWLVTKFTDLVAGVKEKVDAVAGFFKGLFDKVVGSSYVPDLINGIGTWFGKLGAVMVAPAEAAAGQVTTAFNNLNTNVDLTELGTKFAATLDNMRIEGLGFKDKILDIWDQVKTGIGEKVEGITKTFLDSLDKMLTGQLSFKEGMAAIWDAIKNAIIDVLSDIVNRYLKEWFDAIGRLVGGRPGGGGIVITPPITPPPPPTSAVFGYSALAPAARAASGGWPMTVRVPVFLDGRQIAEAVYSELPGVLQARGVL